MGVSSNADVTFGIKFEEDFEFPWDDESKEDYEIEDWWRDVNGFKHSVEIYDERGEYINDKEPPQEVQDKYYDEQREFDEANPLPLSLENYCSYDYPMYILCIPALGTGANRGYPNSFEPKDLIGKEDEHSKILIDFCNKYEIEMPDKPRWWCSSFMG